MALVVNARRIDDRLTVLERRLDEQALDLTTIADLATTSDVEGLRSTHEEVARQVAALNDSLTAWITTQERLTREGQNPGLPSATPASPPPATRPMFAPIPIPAPLHP